MDIQSIGFIGGGRITKIILNGWKRAGKLPPRIAVTDINPENLKTLKKEFPSIETAVNNPALPARYDVVIIALHPPFIIETLQSIKTEIKPSALVISLAPKISIGRLSKELDESKNIVRVIPNAPSIVNEGYNPISFSPAISSESKQAALELLRPLGNTPEVKEELLEAYALFTGMGPTYLWFQLYKLMEMARSFGIPHEMIQDGLSGMTNGAVATIFNSGLSPAEVMDLIPVKPLGEEETIIKEFYENRLTSLYSKLKN